MEIIDAGKVRICVAATRVNGRDYIDIRAFVTDIRGMLRPTTNGLMIPVEKYKEVIKAANTEHEVILNLEPPTLYYFKDQVDDKHAVRTAHSSHVCTTAVSAVKRTPEEYGADDFGYIFKCQDYSLIKSTYHFQPTKPFAVWIPEKKKWVRWEKRQAYEVVRCLTDRRKESKISIHEVSVKAEKAESRKSAKTVKFKPCSIQPRKVRV